MGRASLAAVFGAVAELKCLGNPMEIRWKSDGNPMEMVSLWSIYGGFELGEMEVDGDL